MLGYRDMLNAIAFIMTILVVLYAITKGMTNLELSINIIYFIVLILSQIENLKDILLKRI